MTKAIYKYTLKRQKVMTFEEGGRVASPDSVVEILKKVGVDEEEQEHLVSIVVDAKNQIRGYTTVAIGTVDKVIAHAREIFRNAIINGGCGIILAHNHPSGDPMPSALDIQLTCKVKQAGEIIDIRLLDHVIIGDFNYFSFLEENIL